MSIERAIVELEEQIAQYQPGTKQAPKEGTSEWFLLRAYALGLTHLRRIKQLGVESDVAASERFYRGASKTFKNMAVPDPVPVEVSVEPDPLGLTG